MPVAHHISSQFPVVFFLSFNPGPRGEQPLKFTLAIMEFKFQRGKSEMTDCVFLFFFGLLRWSPFPTNIII